MPISKAIGFWFHTITNLQHKIQVPRILNYGPKRSLSLQHEECKGLLQAKELITQRGSVRGNLKPKWDNR